MKPAPEAARQIVKKMGLEEPSVVHHADLGIGYTYFIVYGKCTHTVDYFKNRSAKVDVETMTKEEVEEYIEENIKRTVTIVGACTGTDAHMTGIDAIMNERIQSSLWARKIRRY